MKRRVCVARTWRLLGLVWKETSVGCISISKAIQGEGTDGRRLGLTRHGSMTCLFERCSIRERSQLRQQRGP